ncbi:MAG: hypothetical protein COY40_05270 [Alphaproteobacteria bacterium CG_4_10_14_0_8_um_filter_53_9]|nr:MAG: hypothetical protein COY40_05270 [Alphaproteobacteria bacterium CG_4_10_14_0_8_um_filter_53_9]
MADEMTTPEQPPKNGGFGAWIRRNLMTGLLVSAPSLITFYLLYILVTWLDGLMIRLLPPIYRLEILPGVPLPGLGLVAGFFVLLVIGVVARNFLGKKLVSWFEVLMVQMPLVRGIYGAVKQVVEAFGGDAASSFREVVMVPYPHKDSYVMGFVTGEAKGEIQDLTKERVFSIFIPTTPNPTSGFLLFYPEHLLIRCEMSVDDGLKLIVSGGIVHPKKGMRRKKAAS